MKIVQHRHVYSMFRLRNYSSLLQLVVIRCTTRCHWLSLVVRLPVSLCDSLSLDLSLPCVFINDLLIID